MKLNTFLWGLLLLCIAPSLYAQRKTVRNPIYAYSFVKSFCPKVVQTYKDSTVIGFQLEELAYFSVHRQTRLLTPKGEPCALRYGRIYTRKKKNEVMNVEPVVMDEKIDGIISWDDGICRDSLVLVFDALPKGTKVFDFEEYNPETTDKEKLLSAWNIYGIRLDGKKPASQLPQASYALTGQQSDKQQPLPDDKPMASQLPQVSYERTGLLPDLQPAWNDSRLHIKLLGEVPEEATSAIGGLFFWGGDTLGCSPKSQVNEEADKHVLTHTVRCCEPLTAALNVSQMQLVPLLVPGEDLTVYIDCYAVTRETQNPGTVPLRERICFEGKYADLSMAMTEWIDSINKRQFIFSWCMEYVPQHKATPDVPAFRQKLYEELTANRRRIDASPSLTTRQKEFLKLYAEDCYVNSFLSYKELVKMSRQWLPEEEQAKAVYDEAKQLADQQPDAHFADLQLFSRNNLSGLLIYPTKTDWYKYLCLNHATQGRVYEWAKEKADALELMSQIEQMQPASDQQLATVAPRYAPTVRRANEKLQKTLEVLDKAGKELICDVPEVKPEQSLLQAIVDQYAGKVVVVDIWDTWCGPCRAGMKGMKPIKEELKDKDVVFVYICDESSPIGEWSEMVPEIGGKHYRLNAAQQQQLQLAKQGIPQYFIFDRKGEKMLDALGYGKELPQLIRETLENIMNN